MKSPISKVTTFLIPLQEQSIYLITIQAVRYRCQFTIIYDTYQFMSVVLTHQ